MQNVVAAVGEDDLLARALPIGTQGDELFSSVNVAQEPMLTCPAGHSFPG